MKTWILLALLASESIVHQTPRPAGPEGGPLASISGRVTDKGSGAPIRRALVVLNSMGSRARAIQKITDDDGRFEFPELAADTYVVGVSAGEFKASHVPNQPGMAPPLRLKPGEKRELAIALERALAISGRVVDEAGLPLSGVSVHLRDLNTGNDHFGHRGVGTDDQGNFRVYGLPAGRYIVCAEGDSFPRFQPVTGPRRMKFVRTCYPTNIDESSSPPIVLRDAEIEGLEIRMRRGPTFSISGSVTTADGRPADSFMVSLHRIWRNGGSSTSHQAHAGRFTVSNVAPGRYYVSAEVRDDPSSHIAREKALQAVDVTSEDIDGIVLSMREGVSVRGVVTFEDGMPSEAAKLQTSVRSRPAEPADSGVPPVEVGPDLGFRLTNLFGAQVLMLERLPPGFIVRSVLYRGKDIANIPTEFDGDPRHAVEIVVSRRGAEVSGRVVDEQGNPAAAARIFMFPVDSRTWKSYMGGAGRSATNGSYRLRNFVPGDYLVLAIAEGDHKEIQGADWFRPNPYERFATIAERVSLLENDRRVIDLRVTPIPQEWKR